MAIDSRSFKAPFIDKQQCWDELLVPLERLESEFEATLKEAERSGLDRHRLGDAHLAYLCNPISKCFEVSSDVIEKRLNRENLWPLKG